MPIFFLFLSQGDARLGQSLTKKSVNHPTKGNLASSHIHTGTINPISQLSVGNILWGSKVNTETRVSLLHLPLSRENDHWVVEDWHLVI